MSNVKAGLLVLSAVLSASLAFGGLWLLQGQALSASPEQPVSGREARQRWPCAYPGDLDERRLTDMTTSAAQAVGLQLQELDVSTGEGPVPGRTRRLQMQLRAAGTMETLLGFIRLAVYEKPALEMDSLDLSGEGGVVAMSMKVTATCSL